MLDSDRLEKLSFIGAMTAIVLGLYLASLYTYLLFHSLVEIVTIAVAFALFILTWNTRRYLVNNYLSLLGIGYAFIALIDLLHTLAYKGMNVFPGYDANLPTQLWIAARYLQAVTLIAAPFFLERRLSHRTIFGGYIAVVTVLIVMVYSGIFPICYVEGVGLTAFKISSEYVITAILLASLLLLYRKRQHFNDRVFFLIVFSVVCTALSELSFTAYLSVYGFANMLGHLFKLVAFYLIYRAVLVTGLKDPVDLIFRDLKQAQEALRKAHDTLEETVRERTAELRTSEEKYRTLVECANDAVFIHEIKEGGVPGPFIEVNELACKQLGYSREELARLSPLELDDPRYRDRIPKAMEQLLTDGHAVFETAQMAKDGRSIPVEVSTRVLELGGTRLLFSLVRDVSERRRAEEALTRLNRELRAIRNCNQTLMRAEDEQSLLDEICRIICDEAGYRLAWVGYAEHDEAKTIRPVAWAGFDNGYIADAKLSWADDKERGRGPAGVAIRSGEVLYVQDFTTDPRMAPWRESALQRGYRSEIALPLMDEHGRAFGVLLIYSSEPDAITPEELRLMEELSSDLAFGITALRIRAERKRAEEALAAEHNLLRTLIDAVPDYIYAKDTESRFLIANTFVAQRMGAQDPEGLLGKTDFDFYSPELAAKYRTDEQVILRSGEPLLNFEEPTVDADGTFCWLLTTKVPLRDGQGKIIGIVGNSRDITERKQIEEAEREQRMMAEALRDIAATLSSTLDLDEVLDRILGNLARVVSCDTANVAFVEGGIARVVRCRGYADPAQAAALMDQRWPVADVPYLRQIVETGQPLVIHDLPVYLGLPEAGFWTRGYIAAPIRAYGQVIGLINLESATPGFFKAAHIGPLQTFADQAAIAIQNAQLYEVLRNHAADLARRVEERTAELRAILDNMGEGVLYLDNKQIRYMNRAFSQLTGYGVGEVAGQDPHLYSEMIRGVVEDHDRLVEVSRDLPESGGTWRGEVKIRRRDGSLLNADVTNSVVVTPDGQLLGNVIVIRDISERKALQAQKDRFIASAAHELRTPITSIKLQLYLLHRQPEKWEEHLEILEKAVGRMAALAEDLLDLSRFEQGTIALKKETVVLQTLITEVVSAQQPHATAKQINLDSVLPAEPLMAYVDPMRITQVITNLVVNAINYTPDQGSVRVGLAAEGQEAVIRVRDTGIGMSPQTLGQIFEPFFRAGDSKVSGVGLGLSISKGIVDLHSGTITVESEVGRGSVFTVRLPVAGGS